MTVRVIHGDCLAEIPKLIAEGIVVDSICCDPPYGLEFMGAEWDKFRTNSGSAWSQKRATGRDWKGQERERPGRLYMRSSHKTCRTCGRQSHQHDDATCAADYELVTHEPLQMRSFQEWCEAWGREAIQILRPGAFLVAFGGTRTYHRMVCGLEDAGFIIQDTLAWLYATGFPKHRSHLKPAFEPIVLAYKPGGKRTMQVDECRIAAGDGYGTNAVTQGVNTARTSWAVAAAPRTFEPSQAGRWPANVCHDGSDEVVACFPESAGQQYAVNGTERGQIFGNKKDPLAHAPRGDTGSAARFFFSAKAGSEDRWGSRHPTVKPVDLIAWLVALVAPPGGTFLDPFAGSGTAAVAALKTGRNAILIEREDSYVADIRERIAFYEGGGTHSAQAKNRNRKVDHGPLFAEPPQLTEAELDADSLGSYSAAVQAIGEAVRAGAPVPEFMTSRKARP